MKFAGSHSCAGLGVSRGKKWGVAPRSSDLSSWWQNIGEGHGCTAKAGLRVWLRYSKEASVFVRGLELFLFLTASWWSIKQSWIIFQNQMDGTSVFSIWTRVFACTGDIATGVTDLRTFEFHSAFSNFNTISMHTISRRVPFPHGWRKIVGIFSDQLQNGAVNGLAVP